MNIRLMIYKNLNKLWILEQLKYGDNYNLNKMKLIDWRINCIN